MESPLSTSPTSTFNIRSSRVCARCSSIKQACDGGSPCARCTRLSLPCQPRLDGTELASIVAATPSSRSLMSLDSPLSFFPDLSEAEDRALLNPFVNVTAPIFSRRKDAHQNPYRDRMLPIAFANKAVMHSLLALSAGQWRAVQPSLANRGLVHQGQATKELARLLPQLDSTTSEVAFATCLLLCMTELHEGGTGGWKHHLQGAKRLLQASQGRQLTDSTSTFLRRLYRFLDSAATVSTCEPPLAQQEQVSLGDEHNLEFRDNRCVMDAGDNAAIYGIPWQLIHLLDQVNSLAHLRKTRVDEVSELAFRELATRTMAAIDHWAFEFAGLSPAVKRLTDGSNDAQSTSAAFEWALRLRLHQIVEGYAVTDSADAEALSHIVSLAQQVRYGSALEGCLLFPLVMAGGVSTTYEDCLIIHDRLSVMERTCGFGQVTNAKALVGRVWKDRERTHGTNEIVNWTRIRYYEMGGLAVF